MLRCGVCCVDFHGPLDVSVVPSLVAAQMIEQEDDLPFRLTEWPTLQQSIRPRKEARWLRTSFRI